jgi:hypothetical protein
MNVAVALWILVPLALVHVLVRRNRALLLFQVAVDVGLVLLPGRLLLRGLDLGPGVPGATEWGGPVTVTGSPEQTDLPLQLAVWWEEVGRLAGTGEYPWISDRIGGGTPLYANGQTEIPFPLQLPVWALGAERGTDVMALWKLELMALGGFLFLRRLRLRPAACAVGSLAFTFGLHSMSWLVSPVTWVMAATPWAWWLLLAVLRRSRLATVGLAIVLGVLAGWSVNPETAAFLWLAVAVAGVILGYGRWRRLRPVVGAFVVAGAVAGLGAVPTVITVMDSSKMVQMARGGEYPSRDITWALRARVASLLLAPWRLGDPATGTWEERFPAAPVSLGVGCIAICCLLAGTPQRRLRRAVAALAAVGALAAAVFWQVPGIAQILSHVPVLSVMVWSRAGFLVSFAVAMLAGIGFDGILRRRRRLRFAFVAFLVQGMVASLALTAANGQARRRSVEVGWYPALAAGLSPAILALGGALVPAVVLAEECTLGAGLLPGSKPVPDSRETAMARNLRQRAAVEGGRVLGLGPALPANLGAWLGLADLRSHSPVRSLALARLHRALGAEGMDLPGPVTKPWAGLAGAWGVRWLATPPQGPSGACAAGWQEIYTDSGGRLYRNTRTLPVMRLASRAVASPGDPADGAWEALDFATTAVLDTPIELGGEGTIAEVESRPWKHVAHVRARGRVLAVLHVPLAPGWRAWLDGRVLTPVGADLGAMGVVVPEGDHEVRWEYTPPGLGIGVGLTLVGLAACLLLSVSSSRRRR